MAGVTMSCNIDVETYSRIVKEKLHDKTISRYLRNLIEADLAKPEDPIPEKF